MRVDDATQRELDRRGELVAGDHGEQRGKQQKRSWRGSTEGQSTPDTEQRGEETDRVQ